jgi:hypothetical protein
MKKLVFAIVILSLILVACAMSPSVNDIEQSQQKQGGVSIVQNQPIPDLGGYSLERQIVIETYLARNSTIATYSYMITYDGKIIEICPSIAYPIPYSTRLTSPDKILGESYANSVVSNAEPNSLYPPGDAAPTLVQCVNADGSVSPVYIEWYVLAFPFRIESDAQLKRIGEPSFTIDINKKSP